MARIVEVAIECDFCDKRVTEGELAWDSRPIIIDGVTYLVDACPCVEDDQNWSVRGVLQRIKDDSRVAEEGKPKKRRKSTSPKEPEDEAELNFKCPHCPRRFEKQHGLTMHTTIKHKGELSAVS